jgi:hypothetical protein
MKKIITTLLLGFLAAGFVLALDRENFLELSGEIKSGFLYDQKNTAGETTTSARIHNNDDAGSGEGRVRIGIAMQTRNVGIRTQFYQDNFNRKADINAVSSSGRINTDFAYAYGNMFNGQLKISAGLLGESPWGTGGPELNVELEKTDSAPTVMGIRTEWKPTFSPFLRGLNVGFVLNRSDEGVPPDAKEKFGDIFKESVVGIAWEHSYFTVRFAYRFDRAVRGPASAISGAKLVYRVEERLLWMLLPGLQLSANGYCEGLNAEGDTGSGQGEYKYYIQNWFYARYDPMNFTAGFDVGYKDDFKYEGQQLEMRPSFYYKIIPNFLTAGVMGGIVIGFNSLATEGVPYKEWYVEPAVKFNIINKFFIDLVYRYTSTGYKELGNFDYYNQWVNLRLCYTF